MFPVDSYFAFLNLSLLLNGFIHRYIEANVDFKRMKRLRRKRLKLQ